MQIYEILLTYRVYRGGFYNFLSKKDADALFAIINSFYSRRNGR
jgi:hypothetical protein